jgi:hypothetical protein
VRAQGWLANELGLIERGEWIPPALVLPDDHMLEAAVSIPRDSDRDITDLGADRLRGRPSRGGARGPTARNSGSRS